jgi:hypothetical protein
MLEQSEMDKIVLDAKKQLNDEQIKEAMRKCSYGGKPITMDLKGGDMRYGKTNA